jgi:hypothetical protein
LINRDRGGCGTAVVAAALLLAREADDVNEGIAAAIRMRRSLVRLYQLLTALLTPA